MSQPFDGVESYYQRYFQQIKERHHPQGTGGDMDALIAMVEWLWKRYESAASPAPTTGELTPWSLP